MSTSKVISTCVVLLLGTIGLIVTNHYTKDAAAEQALIAKDKVAVEAAKIARAMPEPDHVAANPELAKLNSMQAEIKGMDIASIEKEMAELKIAIEKTGLLNKGARPEEATLQNPQIKEMLMRMALMRVEKNKREAQAANNTEQ